MASMMIELVLEVNRAFSAAAAVPRKAGALPQALGDTAPLALHVYPASARMYEQTCA
jgi:hypothetical protein